MTTHKTIGVSPRPTESQFQYLLHTYIGPSKQGIQIDQRLKHQQFPAKAVKLQHSTLLAINILLLMHLNDKSKIAAIKVNAISISNPYRCSVLVS